MKEFVCYENFGAVGDGLTNDFFAMKAAHAYANENGLPVKGTPGKAYLVTNMEENGTASSIEIKTDTDWCGANIIIDDTDIAWVDAPGEKKNYNTPVFTILNDYPSVTLPSSVAEKLTADGGIHSNSVKKIETGLGYPAMLIVHNEEKRVFIRFGGNQNSGVPQRELIHVDKDGNIDESTPFLFDYDKVTKITAVRTDTRPITVGNGKITSRASQVNLVDEYHSISRGIAVLRPNTTITNLYHEITGEHEKYEVVDGVPFIGHSYGGILSIGTTHNILVENSTFQARVYYLQGTYDIGATMVNQLVFKNCDQSNFFSNDRPDQPLYPGLGRLWGVMGSNYCKNMVYDGCRLTRYDAHAGVYNGKVINSEFASLRLTGGGDMLIENCKFYSYSNLMVSMREDYGSTWHGTVTIKDCEILDVTNTGKLASIVTAPSPNHDFGYPTYFPNLIIDNLKIQNAKPTIQLVQHRENAPGASFYYRSVCDPAIGVEGAVCGDGIVNQSVYHAPEFIKVINNEQNGYEIELFDVPFFKDTEVVGLRKVPFEQ